MPVPAPALVPVPLAAWFVGSGSPPLDEPPGAEERGYGLWMDVHLRAIDAALEGRGAERPPRPWLGWLLVALMRQRARQGWHRFILETRLRAAEDEEGDVPGLPGWRYWFHGIGCCLTGPDGELVDVDRRDDEAAVIDPWFFARRVESIRARSPEAELWRWMPDAGLVVASLADLRELGATLPFEGDHLFRLAPAVEARVKAVAAIDFEASATAALWRGALGDAGDPALFAAHRAWLRSRVLESEGGHAALEGAARVLAPDDLSALCRELVATRAIGPSSGKAIELLRRQARGDDDAREAVRALLRRASPTEDPPYAPYQAIAYSLERGDHDDFTRERFDAFASVEKAAGFLGNPFLGEYAVLALRFLPERALVLVRRALRSSTPICVTEIAAVLAAVDQPWCVRELAAALRERPRDATLAEALRQSTSELARATATKHYRPPTHDPTTPGFSWEEVAHESVGELFQGPLDAARPLVDELRLRYPPGWEG